MNRIVATAPHLPAPPWMEPGRGPTDANTTRDGRMVIDWHRMIGGVGLVTTDELTADLRWVRGDTEIWIGDETLTVEQAQQYARDLITATSILVNAEEEQ